MDKQVHDFYNYGWFYIISNKLNEYEIQEEIYCYTIEKLLLLRISSVCSVSRVIFLEISRIFNHLLAVVTHAIDVGAFSPFLWAFEEREKLIEC